MMSLELVLNPLPPFRRKSVERPPTLFGRHLSPFFDQRALPRGASSHRRRRQFLRRPHGGRLRPKDRRQDQRQRRTAKKGPKHTRYPSATSTARCPPPSPPDRIDATSPDHRA